MEKNSNYINSTAKIYKEVVVEKSYLDEGSIIGDFSRIRNSRIGKMVRIDRNNFIADSILRDYSYTGNFTVIMKATIGKFCSISWGCTIGPGDHDYSRITTHDFLYNERYGLLTSSDVNYDRYSKIMEIGNDVWIGCNATILRGVKIGHGAVVGANSLVKEDIPPYAIVGGIPAKIIKYRFEEKIVKQLLECKWWDLPANIIKDNIELFSDKNIEGQLSKLIEIKG